MKGIVNKPQFDTNIFKPGVAICIKKVRTSYSINAIITHSDPLRIKYVYSDEDDSYDTSSIEIDEVVNQTITIELLTKEEENK